MASLALSIVVRIENVPWTANALDIRKFFAGLNIPEGGVHIVGGERGIAFVGFQTDEDMNKAMQLNGGIINNSQINLQPSSRAEMANLVEQARSGKLNMAAQLFPNAVKVPFLASSRVPYSQNFRENEVAPRTKNVAPRVQPPQPPLEPVQPIVPTVALPIDVERKRISPEDFSEEARKRIRVQDVASVSPEPKEWFVELRNLQKDTTRTQISMFLYDCMPATDDDVVIVPWMGRALVRLIGTQELHDNAVKKNGEIMRGMTVEVVEVTNQEFAMAKDAIREAAAAVAAASIPAVPVKATRSPQPPGISKSPPQLPSVTTEYIKLGGLPPQYQWHNIRALFPSARIAKDGVKLEKSSQGQFTGVAFLKFANLEECGKALERLCSMKYEVALLTRDEYERGIAAADGRAPSAEPSPNPNVRYVAVKNVEDGTTAENVCSIFRGLDVNPPVDVVFRSGGHVALVRLKSEADQQSALRRNRSLLGMATVTVEPASHADFEQAISQVNFPQVGLPGCSIMMQNLNPAMDQREVLAMVEPFQPLPDTLRMHYDESGRATGRAIIAFARPDSAQRASAQLNGRVIAGQSLAITVF